MSRISNPRPSFDYAFLSGELGSLGAHAFGAAVGSDFANKAIGQITFGALSGGIGAELSGGNFWQGAVIEGIVAGLNHAMHEIDSPLDDDGKVDQEKVETRKHINQHLKNYPVFHTLKKLNQKNLTERDGELQMEKFWNGINNTVMLKSIIRMERIKDQQAQERAKFINHQLRVEL